MDPMKRILLTTYAAVAYLGFLAVLAWAVAFVADVPLPTAIDHGTDGPRATAVLIDLALLSAFAAQHSVMARDSVKRVLGRIVPKAAERSTYVLATDLVLALLLWQWRPIDGSIWHVQGQPWRDLLWVVYAIGWGVAVAATFMIDHLSFVGLRQATTGRSAEGPFVERWLYAWVRHPLLLGVLIAFWATPDLTAGHLLFAGASTGYILVGARLEERDLRRHLGEPYREYAARTPALLPGLRSASTPR
jgi:protein-S-isoprenylcysteine O-methyltransferase Ste14